MSQVIISVGREFGSGGKAIAEQLAKRFNIPIYDRHLITEIADKTGLAPEEIEKYNEKPKNHLLSRRVNGYSNSIEDNIAEMQFTFLREKAASGESFVVVGRCSETKLRDFKCTEDKAKAFIDKKDRKRKRYHNYHCDGHWGDSRLYDLSINSSRLGLDRTVDLLEKYIRSRMGED